MPRTVRTLVAAALVVTGTLMFASGNAWAPAALDALPDSAAGAWLELLLPLLPMAMIIAGAVTYRAR
jgi:hypothetical protein